MNKFESIVEALLMDGVSFKESMRSGVNRFGKFIIYANPDEELDYQDMDRVLKSLAKDASSILINLLMKQYSDYDLFVDEDTGEYYIAEKPPKGNLSVITRNKRSSTENQLYQQIYNFGRKIHFPTKLQVVE